MYWITLTSQQLETKISILLSPTHHSRSWLCPAGWYLLGISYAVVVRQWLGRMSSLTFFTHISGSWLWPPARISAGTVSGNIYTWPLSVDWASSQYGSWVPRDDIPKKPAELPGSLWSSHGIHKASLLPYSIGKSSHKDLQGFSDTGCRYYYQLREVSTSYYKKSKWDGEILWKMQSATDDTRSRVKWNILISRAHIICTHRWTLSLQCDSWLVIVNTCIAM